MLKELKNDQLTEVNGGCRRRPVIIYNYIFGGCGRHFGCGGRYNNCNNGANVITPEPVPNNTQWFSNRWPW